MRARRVPATHRVSVLKGRLPFAGACPPLSKRGRQKKRKGILTFDLRLHAAFPRLPCYSAETRRTGFQFARVSQKRRPKICPPSYTRCASKKTRAVPFKMADSGAKNKQIGGKVEVTSSETTSNGPSLRCRLGARGQKGARCRAAPSYPASPPGSFFFFQASTELLSNRRRIPGSGRASTWDHGGGRPSSLSAAAFLSATAAIFQLFLHRVLRPIRSFFFW